MFEGDSADTCAGKLSLMSMGGRAEGLACADPGARTPIGVSGNLNLSSAPVSYVPALVAVIWQMSPAVSSVLQFTPKEQCNCNDFSGHLASPVACVNNPL